MMYLALTDTEGRHVLVNVDSAQTIRQGIGGMGAMVEWGDHAQHVQETPAMINEHIQATMYHELMEASAEISSADPMPGAMANLGGSLVMLLGIMGELLKQSERLADAAERLAPDQGMYNPHRGVLRDIGDGLERVLQEGLGQS